MGDKIMVVEDDPEMRANISELLTLSGYEVIPACNGKDALEQMRNVHPNLVLCDIMMPELDGFGVLRAMQNLPGLTGIPFVFLTARSEKDDFRRGMDLGADDYLTKPFQGDELLKVVDARLKKSRMFRKVIEEDVEGLNDFMQNAKRVLGPQLVADHHEKKKLRKKDVIFMEGDSSSYLYFVCSGKIKTYRTNDDGKEYITGIYGEGDFFGYLTLVDGSVRKETAMTLECAEVTLFSRQDFLKLLSTDRNLSLQFISFVMKSLDDAEQRLLHLAYDSVRRRVAEALLFLCHRYQIKDGESIPMSRDVLSALAGISPESASRNLSDFRDEGIIETNHGTVLIKSINRLEHMKY